MPPAAVWIWVLWGGGNGFMSKASSISPAASWLHGFKKSIHRKIKSRFCANLALKSRAIGEWTQNGLRLLENRRILYAWKCPEIHIRLNWVAEEINYDFVIKIKNVLTRMWWQGVFLFLFSSNILTFITQKCTFLLPKLHIFDRNKMEIFFTYFITYWKNF